MSLRRRLAVTVTAAAAVVPVAACAGKELPLPLPTEKCVARSSEHTVVVTPEQAYYVALISGQSERRGLPARAASIALATVYQETGIRNLDHGDRDSVGLFQQRPSQGWGTVEQIMDPYYSTNKFYDVLVKVPNWQDGDINDVAQAVQRSGHPDAYRKHETNARTLASVLTGHSPAGLTCIERNGRPGDQDGLVEFWNRNRQEPVQVQIDDNQIRVTALSTTDAWSLAHQALATSSRFGTVSVQVGNRRTSIAADQLPTWVDADTHESATTVVVTLR